MEQPLTSPVSGQVLENGTLIPNYHLRSQVAQFADGGGQHHNSPNPGGDMAAKASPKHSLKVCDHEEEDGDAGAVGAETDRFSTAPAKMRRQRALEIAAKAKSARRAEMQQPQSEVQEEGLKIDHEQVVDQMIGEMLARPLDEGAPVAEMWDFEDDLAMEEARGDRCSSS